jgi:hypothetical protein
MTAYRMLSDDFLSKHRAFMAANSKTMLSNDSRGAHDAVTPELRKQLARMTPAQKREIKLAMDAGEDPNENLDEKKFAAKLLQALGDGRDDSGFGEKLIRLLDQTFPGCCGELTEDDEVQEETMANRDGGGAEDDDDEDDWSPEGQFRKAAKAANDTFNSAEQPGPAAKSGPKPFPGMPKPGGKLVGMDAASDDYSRRFPETRRIGIDDNYGKQSSVPRSPLNKLAFDAKVAKRVNSTLDDADDYEKRFPTTFGILG